MTTTYTYNADGARVKKSLSSGGTTYYVGNHYEVSTPPTTTTKYYYFGAQRVAMNQAGTLYYLHADHLGSTSVASNASGGEVGRQTYLAFGSMRTASGNLQTDFTFTGQKFDASDGLMYYGARYYDAALGRFISADTITPRAFDPQALNRYTYVRNNPVKYVDPTGRAEVCDDFGSGCGKEGTGDPDPGRIACASSAAKCNSDDPSNNQPPEQKVIDLIMNPRPWQTDLQKELFAYFRSHPGYNPYLDPDLEYDQLALVLGDHATWQLYQQQLAGQRPDIQAFVSGSSLFFIVSTVSSESAGKGIAQIKAGSAGGPSAGKFFPKSVKNQAFQENPEGICVYCGQPGTATDVDHAIPKSRGGNATIDNAQLTCPHCNRSKGAGDFPITPPMGYEGVWPPPWWR